MLLHVMWIICICQLGLGPSACKLPLTQPAGKPLLPPVLSAVGSLPLACSQLCVLERSTGHSPTQTSALLSYDKLTTPGESRFIL